MFKKNVQINFFSIFIQQNIRIIRYMVMVRIKKVHESCISWITGGNHIGDGT